MLTLDLALLGLKALYNFCIGFCMVSYFYNYLFVSSFFLKVEENRKYRLHTMFPKAGDSIFINAREVVNKFDLKQGRYVVIPSTYEPQTPGHFMMRIFTEKSSNAM